MLLFFNNDFVKLFLTCDQLKLDHVINFFNKKINSTFIKIFNFLLKEIDRPRHVVNLYTLLNTIFIEVPIILFFIFFLFDSNSILFFLKGKEKK